MAPSNTLVLVLAIVGFCSVANAAEITPLEFARAIIKMCIRETNTGEDLMNTYVNKGTFPDDKKCFFMCLLQGAKGMDKNGAFDRDNVVRFVPEERRHTIDQCISESHVESDPCQKSFHFHSCFRENQLDWYQDALKRVMSDGFLS